MLSSGIFTAAPSFGQSFEIGPCGPSVDLRSREQRLRDFDCEEARREDRRNMRREMRRRELQDDNCPRRRRDDF